MIEALATGTPVIAFNHGSVPEIIEHGKTGFVVNNMHQAVEAVEKIYLLERSHCREVFERSFTSTVMAGNYVSLYEQICRKEGKIFHLQAPSNWSPKEKYASYD
jgi:glycosyltransferase involved in cell wall biosynthesis